MSDIYLDIDGYIQLITALIALVAVIVGPMVSLIIAKKQLRGQLIYANEINNQLLLRDALNSILAEFAMLCNTVIDKNLGRFGPEEYMVKFDSHFNKMIFLRDRIALLLDVKSNKKHYEFYSEIRQIVSIATEKSTDKVWEEKVIKLSNRIADLGIDILAEANKSIKDKI